MVFVAFAAVIALGVSFAYRFNQSIRGAYAVWWVADMCIEYMDANNGNWPRKWGDLRDDYQICIMRSGQPWTFDELSSRVEIDWKTEPKELRDASIGLDAPEFRVIWLRDGTNAHWAHQEPNQKVLNYLNSESKPGGVFCRFVADRNRRCEAIFALFEKHVKVGQSARQLPSAITKSRWIESSDVMWISGPGVLISGPFPIDIHGESDDEAFKIRLYPRGKESSDYLIYVRLSGSSEVTENDVVPFFKGRGRDDITIAEFALSRAHDVETLLEIMDAEPE